jgi:hypothetical protein
MARASDAPLDGSRERRAAGWLARATRRWMARASDAPLDGSRERRAAGWLGQTMID